jgi:hypothetical protein
MNVYEIANGEPARSAQLAARSPHVASRGTQQKEREMRIRKTSIALVAVVAPLLFTFAASAQLAELKNTTPEQRAKALTEMMTTKLGLTPEQTGKVANLNLTYAKKMDPLIKGSEGPLVRMREMKQINEAKEAELKQILSPQQFEKYLASKEEMREKLVEKVAEGSKGGAQ